MKKYELLKHFFGYDQFRTGQEDIIDNIENNKDVLGVMPTGGGKSLCYQLPALLFDSGITLVISPLIALMKDQVDSLTENGISATFLNSTLSAGEESSRIMGVRDGKYKLLYVAPERLLTSSFYNLCQSVDINLIAIDEAHCISQWGHDFRPSYRDIPKFISSLKNRPVITAFTATATKSVIEDIKTLIKLDNPFELVTGFNRPNLFYKVVKPTHKLRNLTEYLKDQFSEGSGVIYCATRKTVESLCGKLATAGFSVGFYHGGMTSEDRNQVQNDFMLDNIKIIIATNAFGMGIDKPDVRFVIHYDMPKNMEAYYQEAGRAGRDGNKSDCILMYSPSDIVKQKLMISQNDLSPERQKAQLENLHYLVNYCHSDKCLRSEIINYFGEEAQEENCSSCGNCIDVSEYVDVTIEAQKIMSCIYRTNQRFGLSVIIKTLRGSKDKKVLNWGLDKLSTYNIMADYSEGAIRELVMNLIARGYINMTTTEFPILELSRTSRAVLVGGEKVLVKKETMTIKDKKSKSTKRKTDLQVNPELLNLLLDKRKELASEKGVPLYVIFNNASLEEMSYYMPATKNAFLEIKGVGDKKYDTYGEIFLDIITDFIDVTDVDKAVIDSRKSEMYIEVETTSAPKKREGANRYQLTYESYDRGYSLDEIAKERDLTVNTIINHFEFLINEGRFIDFSRFVNPLVESEITSVINEIGPSELRPIKDKVSDAATYTDIKLVILKHRYDL